jgi:hypothetical protein
MIISVFFSSKYGNRKIDTAKQIRCQVTKFGPKKMMIRMFGKGME